MRARSEQGRKELEPFVRRPGAYSRPQFFFSLRALNMHPPSLLHSQLTAFPCQAKGGARVCACVGDGTEGETRERAFFYHIHMLSRFLFISANT